jgi:hypothetical protein
MPLYDAHFGRFSLFIRLCSKLIAYEIYQVAYYHKRTNKKIKEQGIDVS